MNKFWLDIFHAEVTPGDDIVGVIVVRVTDLLRSKNGVIREKLPTHKEMVEETGLSRKTIRDIAKALKKLGIIEANSGGGSHFVNRKARGIKAVKNGNRKSGVLPDVDEIQFGEEVLLQSADSVANFRTKWNRAMKKNATLRPEQLRERISTDVVVHTRRKVSFSLGIDYSDSQVYYASGYQSILYRIFMALLNNRKKIIVTLGLISETALKTIFGVRPESHVLAYDEAGKDLVKLVEICSAQSVGIVYMSSRRVCPVNYAIDKQRAAIIHELRDTYKFIIIEDDRDVSYFRSSENILMSTTTSKYESLIYLRPYSSFMPLTDELNILCGPAKLIKKIRDKFLVSGKDISAATSLSLNEIMDQDLFFKSETIVLNKIPVTMEKVRGILTKSGFWTADSIASGSDCFLRLQPKHGSIPSDYYSSYSKEHIRVFDATGYAGDEPALHGILISLAACIDDECLEKDLKKFNEVSHRIIC